MKAPLTILVADRNPHVREFIRRELIAEGYRVLLAKNSRQAIKWAYSKEPPDLLIIDPDLPDADETLVIQKLQNRIPALPMIIHTFQLTVDPQSGYANVLAIVEKNGSSVDQLKNVIRSFSEKHGALSDADKRTAQ